MIVQPPIERWRFALGCTGVARFPPRRRGLIRPVLGNGMNQIANRPRASALHRLCPRTAHPDPADDRRFLRSTVARLHQAAFHRAPGRPAKGSPHGGTFRGVISHASGVDGPFAPANGSAPTWEICWSGAAFSSFSPGSWLGSLLISSHACLASQIATNGRAIRHSLLMRRLRIVLAQ